MKGDSSSRDCVSGPPRWPFPKHVSFVSPKLTPKEVTFSCLEGITIQILRKNFGEKVVFMGHDFMAHEREITYDTVCPQKFSMGRKFKPDHGEV